MNETTPSPDDLKNWKRKASSFLSTTSLSVSDRKWRTRQFWESGSPELIRPIREASLHRSSRFFFFILFTLNFPNSQISFFPSAFTWLTTTYRWSECSCCWKPRLPYLGCSANDQVQIRINSHHLFVYVYFTCTDNW